MDKVAARMLRPYERRKLRLLEGQRVNTVNHRHARIILLSRGGLCNRCIAATVGCTPQWVRKVIHRFNGGGVEAITWYPWWADRSEAVRFTADVAERIAEVALSPPMRLIGMTVWSLAKLRDYLIEQGIVASISVEWLRQILRRFRIRWRHTKTWKESADPQFETKYRQIKRLYASRPSDGVRLCVDEFGPLNLQPRHGRHHAAIGHVDRLRATYRRTGGVRHFMGVYDLERDTLAGYFVRKKNRKTFLSFLRWLRRRFSGTLHVVIDNATFHQCAEIIEYAEANNIRFYRTPTGASWLNRIECHFTALEKFTLDNTDYRSHDDMQDAIRGYLKWRNGRRGISIKNWTNTKARRSPIGVV